MANQSSGWWFMMLLEGVLPGYVSTAGVPLMVVHLRALCVAVWHRLLRLYNTRLGRDSLSWGGTRARRDPEDKK